MACTKWSLQSWCAVFSFSPLMMDCGFPVWSWGSGYYFSCLILDSSPQTDDKSGDTQNSPSCISKSKNTIPCSFNPYGYIPSLGIPWETRESPTLDIPRDKPFLRWALRQSTSLWDTASTCSWPDYCPTWCSSSNPLSCLPRQYWMSGNPSTWWERHH